MAVDVKLSLTGFKELEDKLSPARFPRRYRKHVRRATENIALIAEGAIKESIARGDYAENAVMTTVLKGSDRPLVDTGGLLKAITGIAKSWDLALIGVHKSQRRKNKHTGKIDDVLMIAKLLHDGAIIPVSDKMRRLFYAISNETGLMPLAASTTEIVLEGRPFLKAAITKRTIRIYVKAWKKAVQRAMSGEG